ncbi:unnamed protein product [Orchesella dallaii]|uniref:Speckle-type POZ protein n=1 Tax=Orchesella dallaii TaxID=48710 RepID=A0ABP1R037_9HEXA
MEQNIDKQQGSTNFPEIVTIAGETDIEQDEFSFIWTVKHYSVVSELETYVSSPVFRGGPKYNHAWQIKMSQKNIIEEVEYVSLYLCLVECGKGTYSKEKIVKANYQFAILNADGKPTKIIGYRPGPTKPIKEFKFMGGNWGYNKFIASADLTNPENKFVVDDTLKIQCNIWICGGLIEKVGIIKEPTNCNTSLEKKIMIARHGAIMDFGKMFKESIRTDITIATNKRIFRAHKAILMTRSSVFATMFNVDMLEKEMNIVEITDFDDDIVEGMLEHLYTGETDYMKERAHELLQIAEKYDLPALKEGCEYHLVDNLNKENAAAILIVANNHNVPYLKEKTMEFIFKNKMELLNSQTFCEAMKAQTDISIFTDLFFFQ